MALKHWFLIFPASYLVNFRKVDRFSGAVSAIKFRIGNAMMTQTRFAVVFKDLNILLLEQRLQRGHATARTFPVATGDDRDDLIGLRNNDAARVRLFHRNFSELVLRRDRVKTNQFVCHVARANINWVTK